MKINSLTFATVLAVATMGLDVVLADTNNGVYDPGLGTLPSAQGWTAIGNETPTGSIVNGTLRLGPTGTSTTEGWYATTPTSSFNSANGFVADFNLQVTSSSYVDNSTTWDAGFMFVGLDAAGEAFSVGIASNGVRLANQGSDVISGNSVVVNDQDAGSSAFIPMDTTNGFHNYQVLVNSSGITLDVDNAAVASIPLGPAGASLGEDVYLFGDLASQAGSNTNLQSLQWGALGLPANSAGPSNDAYVTGNRSDPGSSAPPDTIAYQNLNVLSGSSYSLGSNETLDLNNGAGTLNVYAGATFISNGVVKGNILNAGLVIVPITQTGLINNTHGGVIQINPPAPPAPGQPVVITSPNPITVNPGTSLVIGSGGFGGDGTVGGGGGGGGGSPGNYTWTTPSVGNSGTVSWDGKLEVTGDYSQTSTGVLRLFVAGHDQGTTYSLLQVDQHISLSGALQVVLEPDLFHYLPATGDTFDMIVGQQGISLDPSLLLQTLVTAAGAAELEARYGVGLSQYLSPYAADPNSLYVVSPGLFSYGLVDGGTVLEMKFTGVPEPSTAVLGIMGMISIVVMARQHRRRGLSH